jgi:hypothetical protein
MWNCFKNYMMRGVTKGMHLGLCGEGLSLGLF